MAKSFVLRFKPIDSPLSLKRRFAVGSAILGSLLLALAYALAGWPMLALSGVPSGAALFFPPAGVALGVLLRFGVHLWPGVFLGAILLGVFGAYTASATVVTLFGSALAATIQTLVGFWMVRRVWLRNSDADSRVSWLAGSLLGVVLLAALLGASINALWLSLESGLGGIEWWRFWAWTWFGHALGMGLFAPATFFLLADRKTLNGEKKWPVFLPLAAALGLGLLAYELVNRWENQRISAQFERQAEELGAKVIQRLELQVELVQVLGRFVEHDPEHSQEAFARFAGSMLKRHPGLLNFTWNPLVNGADREKFERLATLHWPDFEIKDRALEGNERTQRARAADFYLPILHIVPQERNLAVVGLNPYSIPAAQPAIAQTLSTGQVVASAGFLLTQEWEEQMGVVLYHAVFGPGSEPIGIVSAALRMEALLADIVVGAGMQHLHYCLLDLSPWVSQRQLAGTMACMGETAAGYNTLLQHLIPVKFADREWELFVFGAEPGLEGAARASADWVLAAALLASMVLVAFFLLNFWQNRRIQALVQTRTAELAQTTHDLRAQQVLLARAQSMARMGNWEFDLATQQVICSSGLRKLLQLLPEDNLDWSRVLDAFGSNGREAVMRAMTDLQHQSEPVSFDFEVSLPGETGGIAEDDHRRILHLSLEGECVDNALQRVFGTVQDVTGSRRAEAEIQRLAFNDPLTGLPNRHLWVNLAQEALALAKNHDERMAVLFLDLDRFKTVNDSLGHQTGDQLLVAVARRLRNRLRSEDVLARIGGDDFVVFLPRLAEAEDAGRIAQQILDAMASPFQVGQQEFMVSVSIGIALFPDDGQDVDSLLQHADTAMYGAKDAGRNNYQYFVSDMNVRARKRLQLEGGLRRALEHGEFSLHYQLQFDSRTQTVVGVEALLRWDDPERGRVMPDHFIPIAEESGLIVPIGDWVLRAACLQQVEWLKRGLSRFSVAVNISALQFCRSDFISRVEQIVTETGADPTRLELEITETALLDASPLLLDRLQRLKKLGLMLALDDFGTGYSSLSYLKRLPLDRLKLDRSFVMDLPGDPEDVAITSAAISMARDLGLQVIAEGVETVAQRAFLESRGCHLMQGYLFSPPLPLARLDPFLLASAH